MIYLRYDIIDYIYENEDYKMFLREHPLWYRKLTRDPYDTEPFELAALQFFKKTLPDRVEKLNNQLGFASFMMDMFKTMNSQGKE